MDAINKAKETREKILTIMGENAARKGMVEFKDWLISTTFFTDPASNRYHNAFTGGLADHTYKVLEILKRKVKMYKLNTPVDTLVVTALCHDLCKIGCYSIESRNRKNEQNKWESYQMYNYADPLPLGHSQKSLYLAQRFFDLNEREAAMILFHMGFSQDYMENMAFSDACKKWKEVLLIHTADIESSYLAESQGLIEDAVGIEVKF